jgi:hypothetical protein
LEALKRNGVLDKTVHWLAPVLGYFEDGARATRSARSVPVAFTVIDQDIRQVQP